MNRRGFLLPEERGMSYNYTLMCIQREWFPSSGIHDREQRPHKPDDFAATVATTTPHVSAFENKKCFFCHQVSPYHRAAAAWHDWHEWHDFLLPPHTHIWLSKLHLNDK